MTTKSDNNKVTDIWNKIWDINTDPVVLQR